MLGISWPVGRDGYAAFNFFALLLSVMYGRPLLGKMQNGGDGVSLERSCIRPLVRSIAMTADLQGLRGSGSNHSSALGFAMTTADFPDPGPDHYAVLAFAPCAVKGLACG